MITSAVGVFVAQVLLRAVYRTIRKDKAPAAVFDPGNRQFSWSDAGIWAVIGGISLATAKMASARIAAIGWKAVTGAPPPGGGEHAVG